jgi:hypothetical protein
MPQVLAAVVSLRPRVKPPALDAHACIAFIAAALCQIGKRPMPGPLSQDVRTAASSFAADGPFVRQPLGSPGPIRSRSVFKHQSELGRHPALRSRKSTLADVGRDANAMTILLRRFI